MPSSLLSFKPFQPDNVLRNSLSIFALTTLFYLIGAELRLVEALSLFWPLNGVMAGVFARFGRILQAVFFLLGAVLIALTETDMGILFYLYEWLCAALLFCLLPTPWEKRLTRWLFRVAVVLSIPTVPPGYRSAASFTAGSMPMTIRSG